MLKRSLVLACLLASLSYGLSPATRPAKPVAEQLQEVSVTLKTNDGEGSGVVVKRGDTNFVLTAGHVVASLRRTREVVDPKTGGSRTVIEFGNAAIVQKIYENGRIVGSLDMEAEVICFSDADHGEDLAVLRILKKNFLQASATFYLGQTIPAIGTDLYHVGSLRGQFGSNSLTTGIVSQIGRVYREKLYDQTSCTAFPGSSGGGVFVKDTGEYIGMLVRGAGETFNLIVPVRRIHQWTERMGLSFVIDPSLPVPTDEELKRIPIEDAGREFPATRSAASTQPTK